jgi:hypothetical protein
MVKEKFGTIHAHDTVMPRKPVSYSPRSVMGPIRSASLFKALSLMPKAMPA